MTARIDPATEGQFAVQLSSTPRGARLARRLAVQQLAEWGWPYDCELSDTVGHLVSELAGNAARHARFPGRDFRLRLRWPDRRTLRIEVTDVRGDLPPEGVPAQPPGVLTESGRGLLVVEALATRWGVDPRPAPGKTVWAECAMP
ncbi:ATP-binding protein [Streptomyces oceani]|uniref:Histidine kinase/HSP90-like ATPase domain-containing protein n=1 Tax=Streptomyces oceani TaxID=1075402 RepID=A0A1E7KGY5_9ACTN|nr:ATP-binding protein [Streptomyces oceani]OEV03143.1 hypothetical protein AN216_13140 [Streptomyces oceani]